MEDFCRAKTVRLLSHHKTYLGDDDGDDTVRHVRSGSSRSAQWTVEPSPTSAGLFRLKSSHGRYLSASEKRLIPTGRKVLLLQSPDPSADWLPLRDGVRLKLQSRQGTFLRANTGPKPYKGTVTHDIPHRTVTQEWIFWTVDVLQLRQPPITNPTSDSRLKKDESFPPKLPPEGSDGSWRSSSRTSSADLESVESAQPRPPGINGSRRSSSDLKSVGSAKVRHQDSVSDGESDSVNGYPSMDEMDSDSESESESGYVSNRIPIRTTAHDSPKPSPPQEGRRILYYVYGDEDSEGSLTFNGSKVEELKKILEGVTGIPDLILCIDDVLKCRLIKLQLNLPPNRKSMTIVLVPSSSSAARSLNL